ncbi:MAG: hypothetical protein KatS3mg111_2765 [Pirellulaceae bacterium]|nr:MAG: hypothetical protein KatS3mg111_2765 [Pirellulaceae bacterium]
MRELMGKRILGCVWAVIVALGISVAHAGITVTFDELSDYTETIPGKGSYYNGKDPAQTSDYTRDASWTSQGVKFNLSYSRATFFGSTYEFWNGWAYSNVNDTTTAGFTNQYAAFTGTDHSGTGNKNYAVAFPESVIDLPENYAAQSIYVTNTTYAALYIRDGDAGGFDPPGPYLDDDYFDVVFTGYAGPSATSAVTGEVKFRLAQGPNPINTWELVDLTALNQFGLARSIAVTFDSSDVGSFGINTPMYVAIDSFSLAAVPEPSTGVLTALGACALLLRRRRTERAVP